MALEEPQGIKNLSPEESARFAGVDPDYAQRDLYQAIEAGDFPKWNVFVQVMSEAEARTYRINPFDLTKVWPHKDYPRIPVGVLELNRACLPTTTRSSIASAPTISICR